MEAKITYTVPNLPEWLRCGGFSDDPHVEKEYGRTEMNMENAALMVYSAVESGTFRIARWFDKSFDRLCVLHNSTRFDGLQLSYIWVKDGELIPTMHENIGRDSDGRKKFLRSCVYGKTVNFA